MAKRALLYHRLRVWSTVLCAWRALRVRNNVLCQSVALIRSRLALRTVIRTWRDVCILERNHNTCPSSLPISSLQAGKEIAVALQRRYVARWLSHVYRAQRQRHLKSIASGYRRSRLLIEHWCHWCKHTPRI